MITPQQQQNVQAILKQANYTPPTLPSPTGVPLQTGNDMIQAKLQQLKATQAAQPNPIAPTGSPESQVGGDASSFGASTAGHAAKIVQDLSQKPSFTGATDVLSNVAGEAGDIIGGLAKFGSQVTGLSGMANAIPQPVKDFANSLLSKGVQAITQSNASQNIMDEYNKLSAQYPDQMKSIGNLLGISALAVGTPDVDLGEGGSAIGGAIKTGAQTAGSMVSDAASGAGDTISSLVKAPINAAQDMATPIDQNVLKILKNPTPDTASTLKNMFANAKNAVSTTGAASPFEIAGKNSFGDAMAALKGKLSDAGSAMQDALAENGTKVVDTSDINDTFQKGLESRLGTSVDPLGNLKDAPGRVSLIANSPSDTKMVKLVESTLNKLGGSPTVQQVNDAVDSLQGELYKAPMKGAEALNGQTQGFVKQIVGQLNGAAKDVAGEEYGAANDQYSNLKQLQTDLNSKLGANYKNAGAWMKRIFSPSDGGIKTLVQQLEQETGVPIFHDATLAKFAMDSVGDPRAASLLEQGLNAKSKGFIKTALDYVQSKIENPEGVASRIIQKSTK